MTAADSACCPELAAFDPGEWPAVRRVFGAVAPLPLAQPWRPSPEERLRPGEARIGRRGDDLWILADLADDDIFNPVTAFNEPAFLKGDAFEMFFAPEGQSPYFEFHVTPGNARLQLRFPRPGAARAASCDAADPLGPFKVGEPLLESWTAVGAGHWSVLARVPLASIVDEKNAPSAVGGRVIRCSFCRYDWTRGCDRPVLSSASPHPVCDFHRIDEWPKFIV